MARLAWRGRREAIDEPLIQYQTRYNGAVKSVATPSSV